MKNSPEIFQLVKICGNCQKGGLNGGFLALWRANMRLFKPFPSTSTVRQSFSGQL
jgi:hypothetical protein